MPVSNEWPEAYDWEDALTLAQLRAVVAVARTGSFGGAAAALGTSQPSVSRAVAAAESALDHSLFERTTRRVRLQADAEEFVDRAERILADVRAAAASVRTPAPTRRLTVSCLMSVACAHLAPALALLAAHRPDLRVSCTEAMQTRVEDDVRRGVADIAVAEVSAPADGLRGRPLWTEALHLCVADGHPLAGSGQVRVADVAPGELIAFPRQARLRGDVDRLFGRVHGPVAPRVVVQQYATAFELVAAGLGVAVVPACMVRFAPRGTSHPVLADRAARRTVGALWRRGQPPGTAAEEFVDALATVADPNRQM